MSEIEKSIEHLDKRITDIRNVLLVYSLLFTAVVFLVSILSAMQFQNERENIQTTLAKFREEAHRLNREIEISLGRLKQPANLVLLTADGVQLQNGTVNVIRDVERCRIVTPLILKNEGDVRIEKFTVKLYTKEKFFYADPSRDVPGFKFERVISTWNPGYTTIPSGMSRYYGLIWTYRGQVEKKDYDAMLRVYYEGDQPATATFRIRTHGVTDLPQC